MTAQQYEYLFVEFAETADGAWEFRATSGARVDGVPRVAAYSNALGEQGWDMVHAEVIAKPVPRGCLASLLGAPQEYVRTLALIFKRPR